MLVGRCSSKPSSHNKQAKLEFGCQTESLVVKSLVVRRDWNFVGNAAGCVSKVPVPSDE